ncbi:hypothetical protein PC111_g19528, partial [Phytophthora cactorum]
FNITRICTIEQRISLRFATNDAHLCILVD